MPFHGIKRSVISLRRVARPEQRDGRGERGEDFEFQTRHDIFETLRPRPSSTQGRATLRRGPKIWLDCLNFISSVDLFLQSVRDFWRFDSFTLFFSGVVSTRFRTGAIITVA